MRRAPIVLCALVALGLVLAPGGARAAGPAGLPSTFAGADRVARGPHHERDTVAVHAAGVTITLRTRVGCRLADAACGALHGGDPRRSACDDVFGRATIARPGGTATAFVSAVRCPHREADRERGTLVVYDGTGDLHGVRVLIGYRLTSRWAGAHGHREAVRMTLSAAGTAALPSACPVCQLLAGIVHAVAGETPSEAAVTAVLAHACADYLPAALEPTCTDLLTAHGHELIALLPSGLPAFEACGLVQVCGAAWRSAATRCARA